MSLEEEIKDLEDFKKGYKKGFADGYMEAMKEVFELQQERYKEDMYSAGVQFRPPW